MNAPVMTSFVAGKWLSADPDPRAIASAVTGAPVAYASSGGPSGEALLNHAHAIGSPALRALTFHDRAKILKALALYLNERREGLYQLGYATGATLNDNRIDIDGGIGTLFVYASKGRRELPDDQVWLDGPVEPLSKTGSFVGRHVYTPLQGVAVQINAFNFPVWGMLEKFAASFLAGMPSIVKPAQVTSYLTEACVRLILNSGLLPDGALQLVIGRPGDLLDRLGPQDVLSFTGSADTALMLRSNPKLLSQSVRVLTEQDSLNASVLGPDIGPDDPEFDLFIKEVVREMSTKAGQKCTAIRRIFVPENRIQPVSEAVIEKLSALAIGDPADKATRMGALVSLDQRRDVLDIVARLATETRCLYGDGPADFVGVDAEKGAFIQPHLLYCADPSAAKLAHELEAFGPVSTLMGYTDFTQACQLANRGGGSLVASIITHDPALARQAVLASAAWHGRLYFNDRDSMAESTGHGAPMPHMTHGGPGRAGGSEELGGVRGVAHYMQRTAIQGSPAILTGVGNVFVPNSPQHAGPAHPFTRSFTELAIGESLTCGPREITMQDIEHFAEFTGDKFYAHLDEEAAKASPFFEGKVAHGYLLLSFAAGLFVEPSPGPVLANIGLNDLQFHQPVYPGDAITVQLTVKRKIPRNADYGEVRWHVEVHNQDTQLVAAYELITMNACSG